MQRLLQPPRQPCPYPDPYRYPTTLTLTLSLTLPLPLPLDVSQKHSLADRCVCVRPDGQHEAIDAKGKKIRVDTFGVGMHSKHLSKFGCGLAVELCAPP